MPETHERRRTACSHAQVRQEFGEDYAELGSGWWDLLNDLLLVGACSIVADTFRDDTSAPGLLIFCLQFSLFQSGWLQYTLHSSRYFDDSLVHSLMLFVYLLSTACMIVHASGLQEQVDVLGFNIGASAQRASILAMNLSVVWASERARNAALLDALFNSMQLAVLVAAACLPYSDETVLACWGGVMFIEIVLFTQAVRCLGDRGIAINIDHFADRNGCLTMVVLGESVVSEAIKYSTRSSPERTESYYLALALGFLLTFSLALWVFHIQPPRELHAYRRSRLHGIGLSLANRVFWLALLALGTGIKHVMDAVVGAQEGDAATRSGGSGAGTMRDAHVWLLYGSLSTVFLAIFVIRLLHYGGREPKASDAPGVYRLKIFWWALIGVWIVLPLACAAWLTSSEGGVAPVEAIGIAAGCTAAATVIETLIVQLIPPLHPPSDGRGSSKSVNALTDATMSPLLVGKE